MASADDTAQAYLFAMQARALTGTVIDLDSGGAGRGLNNCVRLEALAGRGQNGRLDRKEAS